MAINAIHPQKKGLWSASFRRSFAGCKLAAFTLLLIAAVAHPETPLVVRDPNASFVDVKLRRAALQNSQPAQLSSRLRDALASQNRCTTSPVPAPPPKGQNIPPRYLSGSHGETNPKEHELSEPYYRVQDVAAWGANRYLATGDVTEAACVIHVLLPWAKSKALLDYNAKDEMQVWFQSTWTVASLALSVSVIRAEPSLNVADRDQVIEWLRTAAKKALSESRGPTSGTGRNNHFFWRGLAATAAGVISNDNELFATGLHTYATAIGEMNADGSFPEEMARHELALHYQAFAIEPLVMIAELAIHQGLNIYSIKENGHQLSDATDFLAKAIADPTLVKKYTPETQTIESELQPGSQLLAWTEFWNMRTHDPAWQKALEKPYYTARLSGSTTLYAAPVDNKTPAPTTPAAK